MLAIQPTSFKNTTLNIQNKRTFKANPIKKIKVKPETAIKLSMLASLSSFFAKFFAEDVRKNSDKKSTAEEIKLALEMETMKNTDTEKLVESFSKEDYQEKVKLAKEQGYIVENKEELVMVMKDLIERAKQEYWMEKGMQYWNGVRHRIDTEEATERDFEFVEGMNEAKLNNFEKEFNKFEVIG